MRFIKHPFTPDDGKPYEFEVPMKTSTDIFMQGHVLPKHTQPIPSIKFKGLTHRNWLMRRPAGRIVVYLGTTFIVILLLTWLVAV